MSKQENTQQGILQQKSKEGQGRVMLPVTKRSYRYRSEVHYFPIIARTQLFGLVS